LAETITIMTVMSRPPGVLRSPLDVSGTRVYEALSRVADCSWLYWYASIDALSLLQGGGSSTRKVKSLTGIL